MSPLSRRHSWVIAILFSGCLVAIPLACIFGQWTVHPWDALRVCLSPFPTAGDMGDTSALIIRQIRMPRAIAALSCGACLALAGCMLQGVLRNPLADPFTLGISAGAACGASMVIAAANAITAIVPWHLSWLVSSGALLGALLALASALILGHGEGGLLRENVILAGIAVASFLGAIVALVKALNEESVSSIVFWILGSLQGINWSALPMLLGFAMPGVLAAVWGWRKLDAMALGDEDATYVGINPHTTRLWLLLGASAMTAGCVALTGVIGFVGLVVPHILRMLLGGAHGPLLLAAVPAGGLFLLGADTVARTILDQGQELPVGVVTALVGAPVFGFLIWRKRQP